MFLKITHSFFMIYIFHELLEDISYTWVSILYTTISILILFLMNFWSILPFKEESEGRLSNLQSFWEISKYSSGLNLGFRRKMILFKCKTILVVNRIVCELRVAGKKKVLGFISRFSKDGLFCLHWWQSNWGFCFLVSNAGDWANWPLTVSVSVMILCWKQIIYGENLSHCELKGMQRKLLMVKHSEILKTLLNGIKL